jgi:hypothetical protein
MDRTVLSKATRDRLRKFRKEADAIVKRISAERDALRDTLSQYTEILDSLEEGIDEFQFGLDRMSDLM